MSKASERPIIIVKRYRKGGTAHHGGAWKVAYADFVTALMAFFLVMWLIAAVSRDQRAAIFEYFKNPSMDPGKSPKAAPGQAGPGGASTSPIQLRGAMDSPRTAMRITPDLIQRPQPLAAASTSAPPRPATHEPTATDVAAAQAAERKKLESLMEDLRKAVEESQALRPFKDQLLLDITPEGLRIQIVDAQNRSMFDLGSSRLKDYTNVILHELAGYLNTVPNRISLTGHTDVKPYPGQGDYSNWELSADRANAARRALEAGGLGPQKVARVVGLSSSVLFDKANPESPINRRISIVVMNKASEDSPLLTDTPVASPPVASTLVPSAGVANAAAPAPVSAPLSSP